MKNLIFINSIDYSNTLENQVLEKRKILPKEIPSAEIFTNKIEDNNLVILNKSLKHLEFISMFEMYLEDKNYKNFPIEFLQEFEKIKIEAQLTTLKTSTKLNNLSKAA